MKPPLRLLLHTAREKGLHGTMQFIFERFASPQYDALREMIEMLNREKNWNRLPIFEIALRV
jgi:hypothetical protein